MYVRGGRLVNSEHLKGLRVSDVVGNKNARPVSSDVENLLPQYTSLFRGDRHRFTTQLEDDFPGSLQRSSLSA
jgi:hypothetical protein